MATIATQPGVTVLECSQGCEHGTYAPTSIDARIWTCDMCGHDVSTDDIVPHLEPREWLGSTFVSEGEVRLAVTTRWAGSCLTCGTGNRDHHFSVRLGTTMPSILVNCPESE